MRRLLPLLLAASGCSERSQIALQYQLGDLDLSALVRVETYISVDPSDKRNFFADQPYRSVAQGVGYEVRDFDGQGQRKVLVTHDATLGFHFASNFIFTLLPPSGEAAPPLVVNARAVGPSSMLGRTGDLATHFAVGATLKVPLEDMRCNGVACASDESCCNDQCINTGGDAKNCGACGKDCAPLGDSCQGGSCSCVGGSACTGGKTCCDRLGCVDLQGDPFNCGVCGKACNPGETCAAGQCACNGGAACGDNGLCCAATGCSTIGSCPCGSQACSSPNVCCDATQGICVNLMNDNSNCGSCGNLCDTGLVCDKGACKCHGQICSLADTCCASGCANLQASTANCGMCGNSCAANEVCSGGACKCGSTACAVGQSCCGTTCKNLQGDAMNCGSCGRSCNAGEQCVAGKCVCPGTNPARACSGSETCCPGSANGSAAGCFDLLSDHDHCMSCGIACPPTSQCINGGCQQTSCNPACGQGNVCDNNSLTCKCGGGAACDAPLWCCNGNCVNRLTDPKNCSFCNIDVSPKLCCGGSATPQNASHCANCDDACDASSPLCCQMGGTWMCVPNDSKNCGSCGNRCGAGLSTDGGIHSGGLMCCSCGTSGSCGDFCQDCLPGGPDDK